MLRSRWAVAPTLLLFASNPVFAETAGDAVADVSALRRAEGRPSTRWQRPIELARVPAVTEPEAAGEATYIVQFAAAPVPLHSTSASPAERRVYAAQLATQQDTLLERIEAEAGPCRLQRNLRHALNAVVVRMSAQTAAKVRAMQGVKSVKRDHALETETADTPTFIGADGIWDGTATGGMPFLGEGIVIGIMDSGINHSHPSFADVGGDGYDHTNPLGVGSYLGDCANPTYSSLCNDKLIGSYTFLDGQDDNDPLNPDPYLADPILLPGQIPSADTDGHGSQVASVAAGNVLLDVPLPDGDGNPTSVVFDRISGVAPHANLVAYKVCAPACFLSDILAAFDQAISDGVVDVLNHSIVHGGGSPWNSIAGQAFKNARAAGIFVANSAGNGGPEPGSAASVGNAPWAAGVGATTHPRTFPLKSLQNLSGGDLPPPGDLLGRGVGPGITAPIVYAGDFPTLNGSRNDADPAACLDPFPAGHFNGEIVVCDRGAVARVAKGQNARDGGAGGFLLANVDPTTPTQNDPHVIPAIHINAAAGNALRAWLASGTGHTGTISAVDAFIIDPAVGDNLADFSSRGPYTGFNILAPNTAAPGVDVMAAGAELTQAQIDLIHALYSPNQWERVPTKFGQFSGTSMSSPHVAGAAALLTQAHPDWTAAEVLSALTTTGASDLVKEDGITPADPHDLGGGRVQLAQAVQAGLLLDETIANFDAADPALGGDPATLNVASLVSGQCLGLCSWTRNVRATALGGWTATATDSWVTVSPPGFTVPAGGVRPITITADVSGLPTDTWAFSRVVLTPGDPSVPTTQIPLTVLPTTGDLPASVDLAATRDAGSQIVRSITAIELTDFNVDVYAPAKIEPVTRQLPGDSDNSSAFDDLTDGVQIDFFDIPNGTQRFVAETLNSESPDLDLFVGLDLNGDDVPQESETVCNSATAGSAERCDFDVGFLDMLRGISGTQNLQVFALVQNREASAPGALDAFSFAMTTVADTPAANFSVEGPTQLDAMVPFDVRFFWDLPSQPGDRYISASTWWADAAQTLKLGSVPLSFTRSPDDVTFDVELLPADVGDTVTFRLQVQPNFTPEDRTYEISVDVPDGLTLVSGSITDGGEEFGGGIIWSITRESLLGQEGEYIASTPVDNPLCDTPFGGYVNLADFGILPDPSLTGDTIAGTFFGSQNPISFYGRDRSTGLTVTDDGFGFFGSTPGAPPFVNQFLPDPAPPNDLLAPLWSDWVINYDVGGPRIRGITPAVAGPNLSIIEWDGVQTSPPDGSTADFEVILSGAVDDTPGAFEIVFAYDNIVGNFGGAPQLAGVGNPFPTVGVENATGTAGTQYMGPVQDGLIVCFDYQGVAAPILELSFAATVESSAAGQLLIVTERDSVDNPGSVEAFDSIAVPEPRVALQLLFGALALLALRQRLMCTGSASTASRSWQPEHRLLRDRAHSRFELVGFADSRRSEQGRPLSSSS